MQAAKGIGITVLILLSLSLLVPTALAASNPPPSELPETTEFMPLSGAPVNPGWNYLALGSQSCRAGAVLDELQADAGGGVRVESFWAVNATSLLGGRSWKEYGVTDEKSLSALIPAGTKLALYSGARFYVDMNGDACAKERPDKQKAQIRETRTTAAVNAPEVTAPKANESVWTKITAPAGRVFQWFIRAWTGGVTMVWNRVTGLWGMVRKK